MPSSEQIAVITGGAQGIGGATAGILLERGWKVHVLDRRASDDPAVVSHVCDVTSEAELAACARPHRCAGALRRHQFASG
ncbi:SDR family NAD(P)-dependent oxidoreductase [Mesorhizobium sp. IMUNJ 23033]|uniref:SDR family NAD(P)-dependent oxidoreductase n=1 Tax=Mesorhizobium sp. IMUNJ 23033 TaxID=3378039 RepID=UPI00384D2E11